MFWSTLRPFWSVSRSTCARSAIGRRRHPFVPEAFLVSEIGEHLAKFVAPASLVLVLRLDFGLPDQQRGSAQPMSGMLERALDQVFPLGFGAAGHRAPLRSGHLRSRLRAIPRLAYQPLRQVGAEAIGALPEPERRFGMTD